jgi:hypothetical protein
MRFSLLKGPPFERYNVVHCQPTNVHTFGIARSPALVTLLHVRETVEAGVVISLPDFSLEKADDVFLSPLPRHG